MKLIQQERAMYALTKVTAARDGLSEKQQKEFVSHSASLPAMIHTNGLGQAAAFFKSKDKIHELLYTILSEWLAGEKQPFAGKDLLKGITSQDMHDYRLAQAEAQALMDWVKKFAKAEMKE